MEHNVTDLEYNISDLANNETVYKVARHFNISILNFTRQSVEVQEKLFNQFETEKDPQLAYIVVAHVIAIVIILSNLTVVISSGLILKKGQQPKSTYILLGNVSLADTIVGISIIFGKTVNKNMGPTNPLCIFQIGMLVCPAMVSIFSVGFIAIDRYFYILHGLYYYRYFNTTRVRIGILIIWIAGIALSFMPATGWVNREIYYTRCYYTALFPNSLILFQAILCITLVVIVVILYSIILVKALSNVDKIKGVKKSVKLSDPKLKLQVIRGNGNEHKVDSSFVVKYAAKTMFNSNKPKRSASFDNHLENKPNKTIKIKSKSIGDLSDYQNVELVKTKSFSDFSVHTIDSLNPNSKSKFNGNDTNVNNKKGKSKDPCKWRAVTIVMLTSGSFIVTWMPLFVTAIFFAFCDEKLTNPKCLKLRAIIRGPCVTLCFVNSILNPLIYAWWHKGFKRSVKAYYRRYLKKYCIKSNNYTF